VVGTGSVPVHQELHCDNEASYKLALATSLAVYRPMIEQGREKEAREIQKRLNCELGWVLHMPATLEGLALRVAVYTDLTMKTVKVREIFVPFGCCLLLRADVFHSGHYGSPHNIRLHGVLPANNLEWMDGSLLFLNSARPFSMPDIIGTSTATAPSDMLQEPFNPVQALVGTGKVSGQTKNCNTYISTFKESIHAKSVQDVFDRQYALLQCKKEIAQASLIGGNRASKRKYNTAASKILMANICKERDALIEQAVDALEEAEVKERRQRRAKKKAGEVVANGETAPKHEGPKLRKTFLEAGSTPFDTDEFRASMNDQEEDCKETVGTTSRDELYRYQLAAQEVYYYLEHPEMPGVYEHSIQQGQVDAATRGWQQNPDQSELTHTSI
jgi:hypothetical protein